MAVAHSLYLGSSLQQNVSSQTISFTQSGTPQGICVFVINYGTSSNLFTSITYGSVALTAVSGGSAVDSAGEAGRTVLYFAGSGLPTGTQTITANRTNNATFTQVVAVSQVADRDTEVTGIVLLQGDGTLAEQNVDDGSPGSNSIRYAGGFSGLGTAPAAGSNSTLLNSGAFGGSSGAGVRETTAGQGSRPVGFSSGTTDDRAFVHWAVREIPARQIYLIN